MPWRRQKRRRITLLKLWLLWTKSRSKWMMSPRTKKHKKN
jgi:hypothetical protein